MPYQLFFSSPQPTERSIISIGYPSLQEEGQKQLILDCLKASYEGIPLKATPVITNESYIATWNPNEELQDYGSKYFREQIAIGLSLENLKILANNGYDFYKAVTELSTLNSYEIKKYEDSFRGKKFVFTCKNSKKDYNIPALDENNCYLYIEAAEYLIAKNPDFNKLFLEKLNSFSPKSEEEDTIKSYFIKKCQKQIEKQKNLAKLVIKKIEEVRTKKQNNPEIFAGKHALHTEINQSLKKNGNIYAGKKGENSAQAFLGDDISIIKAVNLTL